MYLFLGAFTGLEANVQVTSNEVTILDASLAGDSISLTAGTLYVNGIAKGQSATVFNDDKVSVVLVSPSAGQNRVEYLYRGNTRIGYVVVSSKASTTTSYDPAHDTLFAYETNKTWVAGPNRTLLKLALNGDVLGELDLNSTSQESDLNSVILACDYHRNQVLVVDTKDLAVARILTDGEGPTGTFVSYDPVFKQRQYVFVAYHKSNTVAVYDDEFNLKSTISVTGAAYLTAFGTTLYVGSKNSNVVRSFTISATGILTASTVYTMDNEVTALFSADAVYVCNGSAVSKLDKTVVATVPSPVRDFFVSGLKVYLTFGHSNIVAELDVVSSQLRTTVADDAIFLNNIIAQPDGTLWVFDTDGGAYYTGDMSGLARVQSSVSPFGIALTDALYLLDLYPTLPTKTAINKLEYTVDRSLFVDIEEHPAGDILQTGPISVTSNKPVAVTLISTLDSTVAYHEDQPQAESFTVVSGEIHTVSPTSFETPDPTIIGFIVGDTLVQSTVTMDNADIIPDNFYFVPKFGRPLSEYVFSDDLVITGIDGPITLTSSASIFVNGLLETQPVTVVEGDIIRLRVMTADVPDFITTAIVTIEDRFSTPFSVSTLSVEDERPMPHLGLDHTYDNALNRRVDSPTVTLANDFEPTRLTIPQVYDASLIVNGVNVGNSVLLQPGDTLSVSLMTTYNLDAPHTIPLMMPWSTEYWIAWTIGDTMPAPFDFGTLSGLDLKQRVESNIVVPSGLSDNALVTFRVPYGIELYVNGNNHARGPLDWRGVPLLDYIVKIPLPKNSSVQLKGYPRTDYGSTHKISVFIGSREGFWTLTTYDTVEPALDYRFEPNNLESPSAAIVSDTGYAILPISLEAETYNEHNLIEFERTAVTNSETQVQYKPEYSTTSATKTVEYNPTFSIESNPFHSFDLYSAIIDSNPHYIADRLADFDQIPSNNPMTFERNLQFSVVTTATLAVEAGFEFSSVSNALYTSPMKLDAVVYSNATVFFTISLPETLEAIVYGSSHYTLPMFSATAFVSSWWTTPLFTDLLAEVYGSWANIEFSIPYTIIVDNWCEWSPEFRLTPNTSWYEWKPEAKPDTTSGVYYWPPVWSSGQTYVQYEWLPNFVPQANTNVYEASVEARVDTVSPIYSFKHEIELTSHNLYEVESQKASSFITTYDLADIAPSIVYSRHDQLEFEITKFVEDSQLAYASIAMAEFTSSDSDYTRTPLPGTTHPGYFSSYSEAVANAHAWSMEDGDFYVSQVPDKGFVWIVPIECANLCNPNDCPARGYIHGG